MPSSSKSGGSKLPEFAPMDPDCALAPGLFRSVPKGSEKRTVELTYVVEGGDPERGWRREVEFISPYVLGPTDLRTLQGLLALAAEQAVYWEDRSWVLTRPEDELGRQLALAFKAEGDGDDGRVLQVTGSLADLARAVGLDERSGRAIATLKRSLKRLTAVTVWLRFTKWREGVEHGGRRYPASRSKREGSCRLASAWWAEGDGGGAGVLRAAINPQLSEVALSAVTAGGGRVKYIRMDMREVRALKLGAARLIHQRLCAWINPGGAGKVKLSTLCTYVFPGAAPTPSAAKRRRRTVRRALRELASFEMPWGVDEYAGGKFAIARPTGVADGVNSDEHGLCAAPEEDDGAEVDEEGQEVRRSVRCLVGAASGKARGGRP